MNRILLLCLLAFMQSNLYADSPLTSVFFAPAYKDIPFVSEILEQRERGIYNFELKEQHLHFFDDSRLSLGYKIALVNALGWGESKNLQRMKDHLTKKYKIEYAVFDSILIQPIYPGQELYAPAKVMSNEDLTLLAYLQAMHDYMNPMNAFQCAYNAVIGNPMSEAANYVLALILAQNFLDYDWCALYTTMRSVRDAGVYEKDVMNPEAVVLIFEYVNIYESSCNENQGVDMAENAGTGIFSKMHWDEHPVYQKPSVQQVSEKGKKVDLVLLNDPNGDDGIYMNWIYFEDSINGTLMNIQVKNDGDVASIETNLLLEMQELDQDKLKTDKYFQEKIPSIEAGATITVIVRIPEYWIYDPDVDFIIRLDYDNNINESNEKNNTDSFHEFG